MNKWKALAILFTVFTIGALQESYRIFTSPAPDIRANRTSLIPMAIILTSVFIFFAARFWNKASKTNRF